MDSEQLRGNVLNSNFNPENGQMYVNDYNPDNRNDNLGARRSRECFFPCQPKPCLPVRLRVVALRRVDAKPELRFGKGRA
jgi:hypothetical protein